MARPDGALVTGQRLTLMFAGPEERQAEVAQLIAAVGFEPHWVGHVRYSRNLEVRRDEGCVLVSGPGAGAIAASAHQCDGCGGTAVQLRQRHPLAGCCGRVSRALLCHDAAGAG